MFLPACIATLSPLTWFTNVLSSVSVTSPSAIAARNAFSIVRTSLCAPVRRSRIRATMSCVTAEKRDPARSARSWTAAPAPADSSGPMTLPLPGQHRAQVASYQACEDGSVRLVTDRLCRLQTCAPRRDPIMVAHATTVHRGVRRPTSSRPARVGLRRRVSRQPGEAEDSLTPGLRVRATSRHDYDAARGNYQTVWARQAGRRGVTK